MTVLVRIAGEKIGPHRYGVTPDGSDPDDLSQGWLTVYIWSLIMFKSSDWIVVKYRGQKLTSLVHDLWRLLGGGIAKKRLGGGWKSFRGECVSEEWLIEKLYLQSARNKRPRGPRRKRLRGRLRTLVWRLRSWPDAEELRLTVARPQPGWLQLRSIDLEGARDGKHDVAGQVQGLSQGNRTARLVRQPTRIKRPREQCVEWLCNLLRERKQVSSASLDWLARKSGFSLRTLRRAKEAVGVEVTQAQAVGVKVSQERGSRRSSPRYVSLRQ